MKKVFLALVVVGSFVACNNGDSSKNTPKDSTVVKDSTVSTTNVDTTVHVKVDSANKMAAPTDTTKKM